MHTDKENRDRAARCLKTMRRYNADTSPYTCLVDFLADAMHWCRLKEHNFHDLLDRASEHYSAEVFDETVSRKGEAAMTTDLTLTGLPIPFDRYEIHGVREFTYGDGRTYCEQVPDHEAQFWSLYGHIPGQGVDCISDFNTRVHAEEVCARITGRRYGEPVCSGGKKPYSVLLLYPDYRNNSGTETYYAFVDAADAIEAVAVAQRQAVAALAEEWVEIDEPADFAPLLVTQGRHTSEPLFNK